MVKQFEILLLKRFAIERVLRRPRNVGADLRVCPGGGKENQGCPNPAGQTRRSAPTLRGHTHLQTAVISLILIGATAPILGQAGRDSGLYQSPAEATSNYRNGVALYDAG